MKILISTLGSRGDTQPYLALAVGLQQAGHRVTLAAPQRFSEWIQSYGVAAHPLRFNPQAVLQAFGKTGNPIRAMFAIAAVLNKGVIEAMEDGWQAAQETDFLIQTGTGANALEAAARRGIPVAFAYLMPMAPTRAFPMFMLPFRFSAGKSYNLLTHIVARQILWSTMAGPVANRWRARLGLPGWRSEAQMRNYAQSLGAPTLYGFSPSILPRPVDWDESQHVTGYWFLETQTGWQPPQDLLRFLENGQPPVYVGFGSMSPDNSEHLTRLALSALELSGQRGVLLTGWGGLRRLPTPPDSGDNYAPRRPPNRDCNTLQNNPRPPVSPASTPPEVFFVDDVPHAWLFPRTAAVVHHGGAGTTAAGLRAGVPGVIAPFGGDQSAWANLVIKSGVGPSVGAVQRLTPEKLANAIYAAVNDPAMRARAAAMGEKIRAENGVAQAVEVVKRYSSLAAELYHPGDETKK